MKTLLVPTDFSSNAANALNYAIEFAKAGNYKIILLHAFRNEIIVQDAPLEHGGKLFNHNEVAAQKRLAYLSKNVIAAANITFEIINQQGFLYDVIKQVLKRKRVQWVVMGTSGAMGLKEVFIGSTTEKIISNVSTPVVVVPENVKFTGIRKIVYATDFKNGDITSLRKIVAFAELNSAEINVVLVSNLLYAREDEGMKLVEFSKKILAKLDYKKLSFHILYSFEVPEKLEDYLTSENGDILAVSTHHKFFMQRITEISYSQKLLHRAKVPMLVFQSA